VILGQRKSQDRQTSFVRNFFVFGYIESDEPLVKGHQGGEGFKALIVEVVPGNVQQL